MKDSQMIRDALTKSQRECAKLRISRHEWEYIRKHGCVPTETRGRKEDDKLTDQILSLVLLNPEWSQRRLAYEVGCSRGKVESVLDYLKLNLYWQRMKYAGRELHELEPDLQRARKNPLNVNGPGALVHMDAKRYGSLQGGKAAKMLIVGCCVVDNFSGFASLRLYEEGSKTGKGSVAGLELFKQLFPAKIRRIYTDNGTEFINQDVTRWTEEIGCDHKTTQKGHPWSDGKAERCQSMFKREIIIPLLATPWENLNELQEAIIPKLHWWNWQRPHFGRINRGVVPGLVARDCNGLGEKEREEKLKELRSQIKHKNRQSWEKALSDEATEARE